MYREILTLIVVAVMVTDAKPAEEDTLNRNVHCKWDVWQIGDCTLTCGGGTRTNTREKLVFKDHGGDECVGPFSIEESCNVNKCPATCSDRIQNQDETGVDCGGATCDACASCEDKSRYCATYIHYYPQFCKDIPAHAWFLSKDGRYGCRKACGLC